MIFSFKILILNLNLIKPQNLFPTFLMNHDEKENQ